MLKFYEDTHSYTSDDNRKWLSATGIIGNYKKPFDDVTMSRHCSNKIDSKWYGMLPEKIVEIWHKERDRSTTLGKWLHKQKEDQEEQENRCPVVNEVKYALSQQLTNGVYPEFILYHPVYGISGQADKIIVKDGKFQVRDYKTSKKIERSSYYKMLAPLKRRI